MDKKTTMLNILDEVEFRTDLELKQKEGIAERLINLAQDLGFTEVTFKKAIEDGSSGRFGVNYKLNYQVIGSWVYKYYREKTSDKSI